MTLSGIRTPTIFLLLFVFVLGGSLGGQLGAPPPGTSCTAYILPAILMMAVGGGGATTAVEMCMDATDGLMTRFRVMPIRLQAVLIAKVAGGVIRTLLAAGLVTLVALLCGFRTSAGALVGLLSRNVAAANTPMVLLSFLPLVSSGFTHTASMSPGVRWFAEHQPFTPVIDSLRGLPLGTPVGPGTLLSALAWCLLIAALAAWRAQVVLRQDLRPL